MFGSRWIVLGTILACAASLAACGGGGSKSGTPTNQPAAGASTTAQAPTTPSDGSSPTSDATPNPDPEIEAIAKKFAAVTFKGTYNLKTTNTDTATLEDGKMVLYKQGDKRLRFDVTVKRDGKDSEITFIQNAGDKSIFCLKDAAEFAAIFDVPAGQGLCVNTDVGADNPAGAIGTAFSDIENADVTVLEKSQRKIAGKDADCFRTKDNQTAEITTACFASDGVLLYSKDESDNPSEIEATDVSGSVSDSDFDAPYEVRDLSDTTGLGDPTTP